MTRADRRGRGLLGQAYARILPRWREQGIELVLGLPNERAGFRYGWVPLFPLGWRVRLLRPERVLARRARRAWLARVTLAGRLWNAWWDRGRASSGLALAEGHPAEQEIDALWARCAADADHGLVRDGAWHRWRYREVPELEYRALTARAGGTLQGLLCFRVREEEGRKIVLLAELLAPRAAPEVSEALLRRTGGARIAGGRRARGCAGARALGARGGARAARVPAQLGAVHGGMRPTGGGAGDGARSRPLGARGGVLRCRLASRGAASRMRCWRPSRSPGTRRSRPSDGWRRRTRSTGPPPVDCVCW